MTEKLLQYIWKFQYFNRNELFTETGEALEIVHPGQWNTNQGPDFTDARIKIGDTLLAGTIELHLQSSQWQKHRHHKDDNYNNVILHVVLEDDEKNNRIPTLTLHHRIPGLLLQQYREWMQNQGFIPCQRSLQQVNSLVWVNWKTRLTVERLQRKSGYVLQLLQQNNNHWEEAFWQLLAKNFGGSINAEAFEAIARSVPVTLLAKHKNQLQVLEAILLGQSGLLQNVFSESYPRLLQREYRFWQKKYQLNKISVPVHFLRMRPASFPTVRLAQLAMLVHHSSHLFSKIKLITAVKDVADLLDTTANDYWHYHYRPDEVSAFKKKRLGRDMVNNLLVNTVVPVLFAYGLYHNDQVFKDRALQWLEALKPESNAVTNAWRGLGVCNKQAGDSQALLELKTEYCDKKKCLDCVIGNALLKRALD
jgi:hypothetical protein